VIAEVVIERHVHRAGKVALQVAGTPVGSSRRQRTSRMVTGSPAWMSAANSAAVISTRSRASTELNSIRIESERRVEL